uniref:Uncharacterized protein n=1 Tax=Vespula pensylvanica TaxID=30213 RepID=A0A834UAH4_VESPE|nr:hypothetical protein H0235_008134 [Vespula pensylvanica]
MEEGERFGEDTGWSRRRCPASTRILWTYQAILIVSSGCKPADLIILGFPEPRTYVGTTEQWRFLAHGQLSRTLPWDLSLESTSMSCFEIMESVPFSLHSSGNLLDVEAEVVGTLEISGLNRRHGYGTPDLVIFPSQFL